MRISRSFGATSTSTPLSCFAWPTPHSLKRRFAYSSTDMPLSDFTVATAISEDVCCSRRWSRRSISASVAGSITSAKSLTRSVAFGKLWAAASVAARRIKKQLLAVFHRLLDRSNSHLCSERHHLFAVLDRLRDRIERHAVDRELAGLAALGHANRVGAHRGDDRGDVVIVVIALELFVDAKLLFLELLDVGVVVILGDEVNVAIALPLRVERGGRSLHALRVAAAVADHDDIREALRAQAVRHVSEDRLER